MNRELDLYHKVFSKDYTGKFLWFTVAPFLGFALFWMLINTSAIILHSQIPSINSANFVGYALMLLGVFTSFIMLQIINTPRYHFDSDEELNVQTKYSYNKALVMYGLEKIDTDAVSSTLEHALYPKGRINYSAGEDVARRDEFEKLIALQERLKMPIEFDEQAKLIATKAGLLEGLKSVEDAAAKDPLKDRAENVLILTKVIRKREQLTKDEEETLDAWWLLNTLKERWQYHIQSA